MTNPAVPISRVRVAVYKFPTPTPESDGTLRWDATMAVLVTLEAGGRSGIGWTYSSPAAASVVHDKLASAVHELNAFDVQAGWMKMHRACRNLGTKGMVMQAISAVDIAWWDLKARLLDVPLSALLGRSRTAVPIYGSGGFCNLSDTQLREQVHWWQSVGCRAMKIKIGEGWGTNIARDLARVQCLRNEAGEGVELMVDANGGYTVGQACRVGAQLDDLGVTWFEEPVSSDDPAGLAQVRASVRTDVTAGEYASDIFEVDQLLPVVDCIQLDVTRCGGYTGWLRCAALAQARNLEVSGHCAPSLHAPIAAATPNLRHVEWFADHARLEPLLVDGIPEAGGGVLHLRDEFCGHGMTVSHRAQEYCIG